MAQDANGTPSTNHSIPKYNTSSDPPSGKGLNAIVDFLDTLIMPRPTSTGVKVWNNTTKTWDSPTGTPDGTKFLRDDGAWAAAAGSTLVTALPGSPTNGQEIIFTDSLTAPTYYWHLRYNSTTTKWHFIGGSPLYGENNSSFTATSTTVVAGDPQIALPLAGDYDLSMDAQLQKESTVDSSSSGAYIRANGVDLTDTFRQVYVHGNHVYAPYASSHRLIGGSAGHVIRPSVVSGGSFTTRLADIRLRVTPVRVG